jgi:hypothetical protein
MKKNSQSVYVGNLGGGLDTVKDLKQVSQVAAWSNADHHGRSGESPIWDCAQQGRVAYSVMQGRIITNVWGVYSNAQPTWRHVSKSPAELTTLARSNHSQRHGALVSLARRFSRGYTVAGAWPFVL